MNLLILNLGENEDKADNIIRNLNPDLTLYLNNNIFNKSLKYKLLDDLFQPKDATKVDRFTKKLAKTWYKGVEKNFRYFNISLPELVENEFVKTWPIILKLEILKRLIKKQKPSKIHIITEYDEDIKIIKSIINKNTELNYDLFKKNRTKINLKSILYKFVAKYQNLLFRIYINKRKKKNNILVIGNLRVTLPFLIELRKNKDNIIIRGGENIGRGLFTKNCDYYVTFKEFSDSTIKKEKLKLVNKWNKIKNKLPLYNVLELSYKKLILEDFLTLIKYIKITKHLEKKIDVIVVHNDVIKFEKTIVKTANKIKIPTITMIEGFLPIKQIKKGTQFIPFNAKIMAVHSEEQKKAIINRGIKRNRLVVIGYPDFDEYFNYKPLKKELIYKRYNIPLNKKIILYIGERYTKNKYKSSIWAAQTQEQYKKVYKELFNALKQFPDLFLIIKKHPSGSLEKNIIKNLAKKEDFNNFIIIDDMDIHNILNASYCIITRLSTMALEAMFIKKPVIIMDTYFDTNDNFGYTMFNAALHAKKSGDLKRLLKLLYNEDILNKLKQNIDKFVNYNYINDGKSSKRMAKLIKNVSK